MALCVIGSATAQSPASYQGGQEPDEIILVSSYVEDNYNVERLLVMESSPTTGEFVVRYKINMAKLNSAYGNNTVEIDGLRNLITTLESDSLKRITNYDIVGYASPDGALALNRTLATERANNFFDFLENETDIENHQYSVAGEALKWSDAKEAIELSNTPNKAEILAAIGSDMSQTQIESVIKSYGEGWAYIKENILPTMRNVEIEVTYNAWNIVENRTLIEAVVDPQLSDAVLTSSHSVNGRRRGMGNIDTSVDVTDDYIYCMLVEMPGAEIDF